MGIGHFAVAIPGGYYSSCMTSSDTTWNCPRCNVLGVEQILNLIYLLYTKGTQTSYNWNQGACWVSGGAIAGIVIGGVVLVAVIVAGIIWWRKKQQKKREREREDAKMGIRTDRMN